jgi:predicted RNA polymerase sigma factor
MRVWVASIVAKEFGVLPRVALDDLESDPEQLSLSALMLLRYADAKATFDAAKDKTSLKGWENSDAMRRVETNTFELMKQRRARWYGK